MEINEVRKAIEHIDVSTARGRRELERREINIEDDPKEVYEAAMCRAEGYIRTARKLRECIECNHAGIPADELESVEFAVEILENLTRRAQELALKVY